MWLSSLTDCTLYVWFIDWKPSDVQILLKIKEYSVEYYTKNKTSHVTHGTGVVSQPSWSNPKFRSEIISIEVVMVGDLDDWGRGRISIFNIRETLQLRPKEGHVGNWRLDKRRGSDCGTTGYFVVRFPYTFIDN